MDIVNKMKELLKDCSLLDAFNGQHIDYTENATDSFGLYSNGSQKLREDVLGNKEYQHSFVLYAFRTSILDYDRINNSSWLLELTYWLDSLKNIPVSATIDGMEQQGYIESVSASNGMSYNVPTGDINDGIEYQLQINVRYRIEVE